MISVVWSCGGSLQCGAFWYAARLGERLSSVVSCPSSVSLLKLESLTFLGQRYGSFVAAKSQLPFKRRLPALTRTDRESYKADVAARISHAFASAFFKQHQRDHYKDVAVTLLSNNISSCLFKKRPTLVPAGRDEV